MLIIGKLILGEFWRTHKTAKTPLQRWIQVVEEAKWICFSDIKKTFGHADSYKKAGRKYVIFNVAGNKFRLITMAKYKNHLVVVSVVMTHKEYSKEKWKDKL